MRCQPRLEALSKPIITCGRSLIGVDWDAPDGLPVHLVFLLLTPTQDEGAQLQILATLARTMGKEAVRSTLVQAPNEQELWRLLQETLRSQDHVLNEQARGRE